MKLRNKPLPIYAPIFTSEWDKLILIGGRGSGKTFAASRYVACRTFEDHSVKTIIIRDTEKSIKDSIFTEIADQFANIQDKTESCDFVIQENHIKSSYGVNLITKGLRTSRAGQKSHLKAFANIDLALLEEMEDARDLSIIDTLDDTLRKDGVKMIIILNTPDKEHPLVKRYFDVDPVLGVDGVTYYHLKPKPLKGVLQIVSNYLNNPKLSPKARADYEAYFDPNSEKYNPEHYYTDILGLARGHKTGQIFPDVKPITKEAYDRLESREHLGQDYGSNDPTTLVGVKIKGKDLYIDVKFALSSLDFDELDNLMKPYKNQAIKGDGSAKFTIDSLNRRGYSITPAFKGPGSILAGIRKLETYNLHMVDTCAEGWHEVENYTWKKNKDGKKIDEPIDADNHCFDAVRYAVEHIYSTIELEANYTPTIVNAEDFKYTFKQPA
jgi:phage terminase large subunit